MNNCSICKKLFEDSELLQSKQDDFYCKECFKYEYCTNKQLKAKKKTILAKTCEGDAGKAKVKKMFSLEELAGIKEEIENRKQRSYPSKRPLQCPHIDCNRYISIYDLNTHFQHEHMDVKIISTTVDRRNPLTFYPKDIRYGVKQCLVLLNVMVNLDETNNTEFISEAEKTSLPVSVAVLASKLAPVQLNDDLSDSAVDSEDGTIIGHNDKILIWAASNTICNYSYTVAVSTISEEIRVKFYGPVRQLGSTSRNLCLEGHGLILSHFHFLGMSENGLKPLQLDVIIHSED